MKGFLHLLRVLYNATHGYMFFFLIGLAMVAFQQGSVFAVGASSLYEVEHPEAMQGYGIAEMAEMLRVPEGTISSRLSRGRKKLEELLKESGVR